MSSTNVMSIDQFRAAFSNNPAFASAIRQLDSLCEFVHDDGHSEISVWGCEDGVGNYTLGISIPLSARYCDSVRMFFAYYIDSEGCDGDADSYEDHTFTIIIH